jgi:hypothetical protein
MINNPIAHTNSSYFSIETPSYTTIGTPLGGECNLCGYSYSGATPADLEGVLIQHIAATHTKVLSYNLQYYTSQYMQTTSVGSGANMKPVVYPYPVTGASTGGTVPYPTGTEVNTSLIETVDTVLAEVGELKEEMKDLIDRMKTLIDVIETEYIRRGA